MKLITTCNESGFKEHGHKWLETVNLLPKNAEVVLYTEGFEVDGVTTKRCEDLPRLTAFKEKYRHYKPVGWEWDVVRFSHKVFTVYDAFYDCDDLCVWMDADCVIKQQIPEGYFERLLSNDNFMALFKRTGMHTEAGLWLMYGAHKEKKAFLDTWVQWYETGRFKTRPQWHDALLMDETLRLFEKDGRIKTESLSRGFHKDLHPMSKVDLGKYIEHQKGHRKRPGYQEAA